MARAHTESQAHGFSWEEEILRVYNLDPSLSRSGYTRAHDIPAELNTRQPGVNVSIKVSGGKSVDMGDILRIFDSTAVGGERLLLLVLFYKQEGSQKVLQCIKEVDLTGRRETLFGSVSREDLLDYIRVVKSIPSGEPSVEARQEYKDRAEELSRRMNGPLAVRPKVDSKNQRRVQCSFPNFIAFCNSISHIDHGKELFGIPIQQRLDSGPRVRRVRASSVAAAAEARE